MPGQKTVEQTSALQKSKSLRLQKRYFIKNAQFMGLAPVSCAFRFFSAVFSVGLLLTLGCSVATTRPVQELAVADSALRAAREVNADILEGTTIPELYRAASENLAKAKREYRLKNFDRAKHYATRATILAERAEFEAIKAGGATPEASQSRSRMSIEGAPAGADLGTDGIDAGDDDEAPAANTAPPTQRAPTPGPQEPEDGVSLDELESQGKTQSPPSSKEEKPTKEE